MNIRAFEQLSEEEKLKALLIAGRVISERKDGQYRSFLYYVGTFYAAVEYRVDNDEMKSIKAFERIGSKERIEWKVLRVFSDGRLVNNKNRDTKGLM
ncbi:MAG TPA: hypothetical protein VD993_10380 [Chitinophagaceae bacterium]|nr:hypothetical protein [Chitinophagaceae bacterium]